MASLLTQSQIDGLTEIVANHFDTFAIHDLIVYKEPRKVITSVDINAYHAYGDGSQLDNITYVPVYQAFKCMFIGKQELKVTDLLFIKQAIAGKQSTAKIKVKQDARDYIMQGKTERVDVDGMSYNVESFPGVQNYLGLTFYYFYLNPVT